MKQTTHDFYVDTETDVHKKLFRRLQVLKTTVRCEDGGAYRHDPMFSRISLRTTWTESELVAWGMLKSSEGYCGCIEKPEGVFDGE